jgi:hypothetical protein
VSPCAVGVTLRDGGVTLRPGRRPLAKRPALGSRRWLTMSKSPDVMARSGACRKTVSARDRVGKTASERDDIIVMRRECRISKPRHSPRRRRSVEHIHCGPARARIAMQECKRGVHAGHRTFGGADRRFGN